MSIEFAFIENNHAKLSIPNKDDSNALKWRLSLIKNWQPEVCYEILDLMKLRNKHWSADCLSRVERLPASIEIDEIDRVEILAARCLLDAENLTTTQVLWYHPQAKILSMITDSDPDEIAKTYRPFLITTRNGIFKNFVPRVRAKLAALEILAAFPNKQIILRLIAMYPQYLGSRISIDLIRYHQKQLKSVVQGEKRIAKTYLQSITKALEGDQRRKPKGIKNRWFVYMRYQSMRLELSDFRKAYQKPNRSTNQNGVDLFDREYFELFCDAYKISPINRNRILTPGYGHGISEIIIESLIEEGLVPSSKIFRQIHTELSKLKNEHDWIGYSIIEQFLDVEKNCRTMSNLDFDQVFKYVK